LMEAETGGWPGVLVHEPEPAVRSGGLLVAAYDVAPS
jgi:hypothetical protein